jgi:DNA topoisomerase I-like protein
MASPDVCQRLAARYKAAAQLVALYKEKKKNPNKDGKPIYLYSERQVAQRNKAKAERLEKLSGRIHKLRSQVKKDLGAEDRTTALTALAVALMDHTYERVGNPTSAKGESNEKGEKHFGVTTWQKSHVSFGKGKATVKYTGKSGVKQEKTIDDKDILSALRKAYDECEEGDLFCHADGRVDAGKVNGYLKDFDITAKDIRGFHANDQMKAALKSVRSKGGQLPEDKKEREKQLKAEFKEALEQTAGEVGHEPSTLSNQYLVPGLEDSYLKDGTILSGMKAASLRLVERYKQADRSKKIKLGYRIVDTRTGEAYSKIVPRKDDSLKALVRKLADEGKNVGIQTVEIHVPESWKKGDPLDAYAPKDVLEGLGS